MTRKGQHKVIQGGSPVHTGSGVHWLRWCLCSLWALGCLGSPFAGAQAEPADDRWAILLGGISGDPALQAEYLQELKDMRSILVGSLGFLEDQVSVLFDDVSQDPGLIRLKSTRENLDRVCRDFGRRAGKNGLLFVFIVGHGSFDERSYKLNLVGPDPTAEDLAAMLDYIPCGQSVVINTTNCSGGSIAGLSRRGRIVATATTSGREKNLTHAAGFFVEAFKENNGDADKNGRVSILEAFQYAARKVQEYYEKAGNLQTEHPVLDDNGDGKAHGKPGPDNGDGFLARTTYLSSSLPALTQGGATAGERELALQAESLEKQIEALKYAKTEMAEVEYEKKLEELLLELARIHAKLRKK